LKICCQKHTYYTNPLFLSQAFFAAFGRKIFYFLQSKKEKENSPTLLKNVARCDIIKRTDKKREMPMQDISKIDKNFAVVQETGKTDARFYSVREKPFEINGVFYADGKYRRLPEKVAQSVSEGVHALHAHTSGGRVRFRTNSSYILLSVKMPVIGRMPHFTLCGSSAFDMYDGKEYLYTFVPPYAMEEGYECLAELHEEKWRDITINFPLYSEVSELYIGVQGKAQILPPKPYKNSLPIVYYGSSITQGGCASRPGTCYQHILSRELDVGFINLGFSGNAKAEDEIAEYIKRLPMSAFIYDYDHNAPTVEHLRKTHEKMFKAVREANPTLPIVMMTRPQYVRGEEEMERLAIVKATYDNAVKNGDKNVYFIDGKELMKEAKNEGTVDGIHPTDVGFFSMAKRLKKTLKIFM